MNKIGQFALNMLNQNPQMRNNPLAQEFISVLQSGNAQRGEEIANNLCQTYGVNRDQAIQQARNYFHL